MQEGSGGQIDLRILVQCAPVITGIKASNMVTIPKSFKKRLSGLLYQSELSCFCLYEDEGRCILLLYRKDRLKRCIGRQEAADFLTAYGYGDVPLQLLLSRLGYRLCAFYRGEMDFPHELGVFLEYPLEDIKGFIKNKGRNSIFSGYWKVYQNPEKARNTFRQYDKARSEVLKNAINGHIDRIGMIGS